MKHYFFAFWLGLVPLCGVLAENLGAEAVVVYNSNMSESKRLALYYAEKRGVPSGQLIGLDLPTTESITRTEYREQLEKPLLKILDREKLILFKSDIKPASSNAPGQIIERVVDAKMKYLVLCYGVPLKITQDIQVVEAGMEQLRAELRKNEAAVDSELSLLPAARQNYPITGFIRNPAFAATNASVMDPRHGVMIVGRLDGPSVDIAKGLVDKALQAEKDGLWGRAYFDARGITNGSYKLGDDWMRTSAEFCLRQGMETYLDEKPELLGRSFPLSQVALYAGWYSGSAEGAFERSKVEFMPGAFAYHLHSFSASSIRSATQYWVGPLLDKGATASMGCVFEPYLALTPNLPVFFSRFLAGFTLGEAALACQEVLSWQTTVVGDPLYRPFGVSPQNRHEALKNNKLIEWSFLRIANLNIALGTTNTAVIDYLQHCPQLDKSAVLMEKLASLYLAVGKTNDAVTAYSQAVTLEPTPQQRVRLTMALANVLETANRQKHALELLRQFNRDYPDSPCAADVRQRITLIESKLEKTNQL